MEITSGKIVIDYSKNEIYAGRIKDTSGILTQSPIFKEGNDVIAVSYTHLRAHET